jgi:peptidoglycan/xylan/chitin deacetylase (PgdA/CDA1 family)
VKDWAAAFLRVSGWLARNESRHAQLGWVLMLHRVLPADEHKHCYNPHLVLSPEALDALLVFLKRTGKIVSLDEFLATTRLGQPQGAITITFDDGWEDNYRCAAPVLRAHGIPACIYLATALVGTDSLLPEEHFFRLWRRASKRHEEPALCRMFGWPALEFEVARARLNLLPIAEKLRLLEEAAQRFPATMIRRQFMDWDQARELQANAAITFGSHTADHAILPSETDASIEQQLRTSQETMARELGRKPLHFAYPRGAFDKRIAEAVQSTGFNSAVTTVSHGVSADVDIFRIPRIAIDDLVVHNAAREFSATRTRLHLARAGRATVLS